MNSDIYIETPKPWSRLFARLIDYGLLYTFGIFLPSLFTTLFTNDLYFFLIALLIPLIWIPIEALFVSFLGSTPGKLLCGFSLKQENGLNLSFILAFKRAWQVFMRGIGFNLPLINFVCLLHSWIYLKKNQATSWDKRCKTVLKQKKQTWIQTTFALLTALLIALAFFAKDSIEDFCNTSSPATFSQKFFDKKKESPWIPYKAENDQFKIAFPSQPKSTTTELPIPKTKDKLPYYDLSTILDEKVRFSLSYTTLPKNFLKWSSGLVLKGALQIITKSLPGTKILNKNARTYCKYPALDFHTHKNGIETKGRLILIDNILYKVEVSYPSAMYQDVQEPLAWFLQSFEPTV